MKLRPPTLQEAKVAAPLAILFTVMSVFVLRGCDSANVPLVHPPAGFNTAGTATTQPGDNLTGVQLAAVDGTTVPADVRATGSAHLSGSVNGPQGPMPGATVRVEHLVEGKPPPIDVLTGADGRWDLPNIAGGRYRVRAFLVPSFAQVEPQVFFLEDGKAQSFDLTVDSFAGLEVTSAIAPDPPTVNQPFTLAVRVARRTGDGDGIVRAQPVANATVTLTGTQGFNPRGQSSAVTDGNGDTAFGLDCKSANASQVQVTVRATPTDQPQTSTLQFTPCVDPSASTTTPTSTSASTSSGSSSSSSSSASSSPAPN